MDWMEAEGNTYDDAMERLLHSLGADRSEVEIEEAGERKKFFGFGKVVFKVRGKLKNDSFDGGDISIESLSQEIAKIGNKNSNYKDNSKGKGASRHKNKQHSKPKEVFIPSGNYKPSADASDIGKEAITFLETIVAHMGVGDPKVKVDESDNSFAFNIESDSGGFIIGRKGETLEALQTVMELFIIRKKGLRLNVVVDTENYRQRQSEKLKDLAKKLAGDAVAKGKKVFLKPMSSSERKIVHSILQDDSSVETRSEGRGDSRRVAIIPAK